MSEEQTNAEYVGEQVKEFWRDDLGESLISAFESGVFNEDWLTEVYDLHSLISETTAYAFGASSIEECGKFLSDMSQYDDTSIEELGLSRSAEFWTIAQRKADATLANAMYTIISDRVESIRQMIEFEEITTVEELRKELEYEMTSTPSEN